MANTGAVTIANDAVETAMIADDAVDSDQIAAGAIDNAHLADNAVGLAEMAGGTDGNIISYDASGNPVAIATGNDGQVLTSTGAGSPPAFEDAAGGEATYVQFPATQVASADANRLDDYEEGTWTPALKHNSGSGTPDTTYNTQTGYYVKVGQLCWVYMKLHINSLGTGHATGFLGFPFLSSTTPGTNGGGQAEYYSGLAVSVYSVGAEVESNGTSGFIRGHTGASSTIQNLAIFGDSARFDCTWVYRTAA